MRIGTTSSLLLSAQSRALTLTEIGEYHNQPELRHSTRASSPSHMTAQGKAVAHSPLPGTLWKGELMCQVKRRSFLGLSATILGSGLIAGKTGHAFLNGGQEAPGSIHHHVYAVSVMTETANRFLAAL